MMLNGFLSFLIFGSIVQPGIDPWHINTLSLVLENAVAAAHIGSVAQELLITSLAFRVGCQAGMVQMVLHGETFAANKLSARISYPYKEIAVFAPIGLEI